MEYHLHVFCAHLPALVPVALAALGVIARLAEREELLAQAADFFVAVAEGVGEGELFVLRGGLGAVEVGELGAEVGELGFEVGE